MRKLTLLLITISIFAISGNALFGLFEDTPEFIVIDTGGGGGGGRTYTGISPITVDNDSNQIGLNVLPTSDWNGLLDGFEGIDLNRTVLARCSGDANSVWTSVNNCQDITGFDAAANGGGNLLRTYEGLAPITVNNDANQVGLNVTPTTDWNGLFDGNNSTFYIDWTNSINRLFSLLTLDDNSSFDDRYLPHLLRTYTGISPINVDNDNNIIGLGVLPTSDWNGLFDGNSSDVYMRDANFVAKGILSIDPKFLSIDDGHLNFDDNTQDLLHFFNGTFLEMLDVDVNSNGTDVNLFLQKDGGGDLTIVFDSGEGFTFFDSTPPATIELIAGSDTDPTLNYIFIPQATNVLTVNTIGFPTDAEHAAVATVVVQSPSSVVIDGLYKVQIWNDASDDENSHQGHESHINSWIRTQPATWMDGVSQTLTITTNAGAPDNVDFAVTEGNVLQLHRHEFPAFDTAVDSNIFVVNDSVTPFLKVNDLNELQTDSVGGTLLGRFFTLVIWGVISDETSDSHLMVNLPSGSYNQQANAIADASNFSNFSIPVDFRGTGFLISKLVLRQQAAAGGTWTSIEEIDLRGLFPSTTAADGNVAALTEFADNQLAVFNASDSTKELNIDLNELSTGTTTMWTVPSRDINFGAPVFEDLNVLEDANVNRLKANFFFGDGEGITIGGTGINSLFWRLDGTNAPPTADWDMGDFNFTGVRSLLFEDNIQIGDQASIGFPFASGSGAISIGNQSESIGVTSLAVGFDATATDTSATAIGRGADATAANATAIGTSSSATDITATAVGYLSNAKGSFSTAIGDGTDAIGNYSTALGYESYASGLRSIALGPDANVTAADSMALGTTLLEDANTLKSGYADNNFVGSVHSDVNFTVNINNAFCLDIACTTYIVHNGTHVIIQG